jgi:hypothetical protein
MKFKQLILLLAACALVSGCTSTRVSRSLASGVIGCPSSDIKITDETASVSGTHEFTAECDGRKYFCSYVYGSNTNCAERKTVASAEKSDPTAIDRDECLKRKRYNDSLICPDK